MIYKVPNIGLCICYPFKEQKFDLGKEKIMKGYAVESGYMGLVNGVYMLFASEMDYEDYIAN